ncbi:hypothetical protein [Streptomyces sp. NPDC047130]|uniref:hypothetical protein n=1 Tax=Streptomyces sp. NPDC047130 TaxID=3155261 RepID=UPI003410ACA3
MPKFVIGKFGAMAAVCLMGSLAACDANTNDMRPRKSESPVEQPAEHCRRLIGADGVEWVKKSQSSPIAESDRDVQGEAKATRQFRREAESWTAATDENGYGWSSLKTVCRLVHEGRDVGGELLTIEFGAAATPWEKLPEGELEGGGVVTAAGEDAKLVSWEMGPDEPNEYSVFVKCRVEGSMYGQETRVPLEGTLTDGLSGDLGANPRFDLLLDAARVMVEKAGCLNGPELPDRAPRA